eukprot:364259-Chlamydomonas_euryale.AAC.7
MPNCDAITRLIQVESTRRRSLVQSGIGGRLSLIHPRSVVMPRGGSTNHGKPVDGTRDAGARPDILPVGRPTKTQRWATVQGLSKPNRLVYRPAAVATVAPRAIDMSSSKFFPSILGMHRQQ